MKTIVASVLLLALLAGPTTALAHGGGLNAQGCHTNRKTGDYHCHRAPSAPAPASSLSSGYAQSRAPSGGAYANCSEARAAGAAPVRVGEPGYGRHLDRDGDGV
ncbi:excalibur calcium-binding domain-containing protein, partial [Novilysobacter longmucuonensis]|uniref:excalibur calcium-binding domain-containing protein n=1 Tax=Novilysobacter longmucuonensis TaxID=3098603 RepID=UPI0031F31080